MSGVTIRGKQDDIDRAKAFVEDLINNDSRYKRNEPVVAQESAYIEEPEQPREPIDWGALAKAAVSIYILLFQDFRQMINLVLLMHNKTVQI